MGRPKKEDKRDQRVGFRLTKKEKEKLETIIVYEGYGTVANYIRMCIERDSNDNDEWLF